MTIKFNHVVACTLAIACLLLFFAAMASYGCSSFWCSRVGRNSWLEVGIVNAQTFSLEYLVPVSDDESWPADTLSRMYRTTGEVPQCTNFFAYSDAWHCGWTASRVDSFVEDPATYKHFEVTAWQLRFSVWLPIVVLALHPCILLLFLARAARTRLDLPKCRCCGYCLIGLPEARCPECGTPFDPELVGRQDRDPADSIPHEDAPKVPEKTATELVRADIMCRRQTHRGMERS